MSTTMGSTDNILVRLATNLLVGSNTTFLGAATELSGMLLQGIVRILIG
jgi:hypothetical protein